MATRNSAQYRHSFTEWVSKLSKNNRFDWQESAPSDTKQCFLSAGKQGKFGPSGDSEHVKSALSSHFFPEARQIDMNI